MMYVFSSTSLLCKKKDQKTPHTETPKKQQKIQPLKTEHRDTIGEFLGVVQQQLGPEFREIHTTLVENLLYVKEDLIIPKFL